MRLRWFAAVCLLALLMVRRAARAGPRPAAAVLGCECLLAVGALVIGARRFTAPPVRVRAGTGLAYHIDAPELFRLGAGYVGSGRRIVEGVPLVDYGPLGEHVNPAYLAWWALAHLNRYADVGQEADRETALAAVQALARRAERWHGGVDSLQSLHAAWTYAFDWPVFGRRLRAPWISAMAQGLAMSALVRAYRLCGERAYLDLALAAAAPFRVPVAAGGVRAELNGRPFYEEYPVVGGSLVLDGSLFALLGLYDVWAATGDEGVRRLFEDGVDGIARNLRAWDFHGLWSWYGRSGHLSTPVYHVLNAALLEAVGHAGGRDELRRRAARWRRVQHSRARRAIAFAAFWATLYWSGLRGTS